MNRRSAGRAYERMKRRLLPATLIAAFLLAACGSETTAQPEADQPAAAENPDTTLVAALGDSITAGSPLWDPDPELREPIGAGLDERSQYEYWASEATPGLEAAAENLRDMVHSGERLGLEVAIADLLPWNNGFPAAEPEIQTLNRDIRRIAREEEVTLLGFHDALEDPGRRARPALGSVARLALFRERLAVALGETRGPGAEPVVPGTVDRHRGPAQEVPGGRGEVGDQPGDLLRAAEPAEGDRLRHRVDHLLRVLGLERLGLDLARRDRDAADPVPRPLDRKRPHHVLDGGAGCA